MAAAEIPLVLQTAYAELVERCWMAQLTTDFPKSGVFIERRAGDRAYWYFREAQQEGKRRERYVGPRSTELDERVAAHAAARDDWRARRDIVAALTRSGMATPAPPSGRMVEALAEAGVFRLRGVLVGTVAFQTYSGLLGRKLGGVNVQTADLDIAQFRSISVAVEDDIGLPLLDILKRVDPGFKEVPPLRGQGATQFRSGNYRVDVLSPNRGPDSDEPAELPALGTTASTLRYLDFLIYREVQAAVLYGPGVAVNVPAPERYALHKLLVSRLRVDSAENQAKAAKDLRQAGELLPVLAEMRPYELRDAWKEMMDRGPRWRQLAEEAVSMLPARARATLELSIVPRTATRIQP
jgi:hypothetical protein